MTDSADKLSLKDLADQDAKKDSSEIPSPSPAPSATANDVGPSGAPQPNAPVKSGGGAVWLVLGLVVVGGAIAAGWPILGPRLEPVIADMRALLGMTPRPTQARLPAEASPVVAPAEQPAAAPVQAPADVPTETSGETSGAASGEVLEQPSAVPAPPSETAPEVASEPTAEGASAVAPEPMTQISDPAFQQMVEANAELNRTLAEMKNELAALSARIQALEDGSRADPTAPAQALVLGVTQLRSRLMGDSPFAAELAALETIAAGDATVMAALHRLKPHAEVGVPSEAALTARFDKVALAILGARSTSEAGGWLGAVKDGLGGLVTVRRTNPAEITDQTERAVAVAEAALELGELGEAVQALGDLQDAPGEAAAAWLGDAHARLEAEAALEDLHRHALTVLSAAGGA